MNFLYRIPTTTKTLQLAVASAIFAIAFSQIAEAAEPPVQPNACQVTRPRGGWHENEFLSVGLFDRYLFRPGGVGFVDSDGALGINTLWKRKVMGRLEVGGRRLDGSAPPARAYINDHGDTGIQPSFLVFPTPGCWEITGKAGDATITFIVLVEKIGDGPARRMQGPGRGSRISSIAVGGK